MMNSWIDELFKGLLVFILLAGFGWYTAQTSILHTKMAEKISNQNKAISELKLQVIEVKSAFNEISNQFSVLTSLTDQQRKELTAIKLTEKLTSTDGELEKLKDIMMQTPEKAMKLERLQTKQEAEFKILSNQQASLKDQFGTLTNMLYVLVGFLVALGIHTLNLHSKAIKNRPQKDAS